MIDSNSFEYLKKTYRTNSNTIGMRNTREILKVCFTLYKAYSALFKYWDI